MLVNRLARPGNGPAGRCDEAVASYDRLSQTPQRPEADMAKKSRKKKARRKNAANHGKRPNS